MGRVLVPAQFRTPPELGWGCVRAARGGEAQLLLPNPSLSCPLSSPHLPRGAPGSVRPWPPQQLPGLWPHPQPPGSPAAGARPRPCFCTDQSCGAGHGCTQSARESPASPAPRAAASLGQLSRAGRGRCSLFRVPERDDPPTPRRHSSPEVEDPGLGAAWGCG